MTDCMLTPRADSLAAKHETAPYVDVAFDWEQLARQLERELAVAIETLEECASACNPPHNETGVYVYQAVSEAWCSIVQMRRAFEENK